jgi:hypothetical protein
MLSNALLSQLIVSVYLRGAPLDRKGLLEAWTALPQ